MRPPRSRSPGQPGFQTSSSLIPVWVGAAFQDARGCGSSRADGGDRGHSDMSPSPQQGKGGERPAASPARIPTGNATNVSLIYFSRQPTGFDTSLLVIWHSSGMYTFWDRCDTNAGPGPGKREELQEHGAELLAAPSLDFQDHSVSPAAWIWGEEGEGKSFHPNTPNQSQGHPPLQLPVL